MEKIIEIQFETNRNNYEEDRENTINDYFNECVDGTEVDEFVEEDVKVYTGNIVNNYTVYIYLKFDNKDVLDPEHLIEESHTIEF